VVNDRDAIDRLLVNLIDNAVRYEVAGDRRGPPRDAESR
jgi:hypothetical protein